VKDIQTLLAELTKEGGEFILNPVAVVQLKEQGVPFDEPRQLTLKESIELLFQKRMDKALEIAEKLPSPPALASPAIESLYNEIRECIIFGLNGAAITLSTILVEFMMKFAAYKVEMGGFALYDAERWDEFEQLDFSGAIARANKNGLLMKENRKLLNEFRHRHRNPCNHYNIKKITETVVAKNVTKISLKTLAVEQVDIEAKDDPIIQAQAKPLVDAQSVMNVFEFADSVVKALFEKLGHLQVAANHEGAE
jgi:hypothetical protein